MALSRRILSAFGPCKKFERCRLVIVDGHQLIESGNPEDLTHTRLRTFKSMRNPKEHTYVMSDMSKRSGFPLGTV